MRGAAVNQVLREEKKYLLSLTEARALAHRLGQVLHEDLHNGACGYVIRSLYFDSVWDGDFFDKLAGIESRRKLRLRCYCADAQEALLEIKQKQGAYQQKRSLKLSRDDAKQLAAGAYEVLLNYKVPFAAECYTLLQSGAYRPKTIVVYRRRAYVAKENCIRITFDSEFAVTESSFDLFSPTLNANPVFDASAVVCEVKYRGFLPDYIKRQLAPVNRSETSVSKYVLARQQAYQTQL